MSHFSKLATRFVDQAALLAALDDVGYPAHKVEIHARPQPLVNRWDSRPQSAKIILRKEWTLGYADTGFLLQPDGSYAAIVDFSHHRTDEAWLQKITRRYAYHVAVKEAALQGFSLIQTTEDANGELVLTFTR